MKKLIVLITALLLAVSVTATAQSPKETVVRETIKVGGLCEMCTERIEAAAKSVEGVSKARWDIRRKILRVTYDTGKTSTEEICKGVAAIGYDAGEVKAPDEVYEKLEACCKYRN